MLIPLLDKVDNRLWFTGRFLTETRKNSLFVHTLIHARFRRFVEYESPEKPVLYAFSVNFLKKDVDSGQFPAKNRNKSLV